ncbi:MAG: alpha-1,2-fucosyltransferase [Faecalibacillus intestinalis]
MNEKYIRKIRGKIVSITRNTKIYYWLYPAFWHSKFFRNDNKANTNIYFAARPNPGAGIGHQMANWIAGYWFAQQFGLKFAHIPFSTEKWEKFLGFYQNEKTVEELKKNGYKVKRLPIFDEYNDVEVKQIMKIISSYANQKIIFLAEQDQFYHNQYQIMNELKEKFYTSPARKLDKLIYNENQFNIAIHIRRGDIIQKPYENNPNLTIRYQSNDYFINALDTALTYLKDKKNIKIYLFSQGKREDYPEFSKYENLDFCLDMDSQDSFLHMVYADALITSKSSFSYKPALLNKGIKFCAKNFWHGYPESADWIMLNDEGRLID